MSPWLAFVVGVLIGSGATAWWTNRRLRPIRAELERRKAELADWRRELLEKWKP